MITFWLIVLSQSGFSSQNEQLSSYQHIYIYLPEEIMYNGI
jgi:hypothetical protein